MQAGMPSPGPVAQILLLRLDRLQAQTSKQGRPTRWGALTECAVRRAHRHLIPEYQLRVIKRQHQVAIPRVSLPAGPAGRGAAPGRHQHSSTANKMDALPRRQECGSCGRVGGRPGAAGCGGRAPQHHAPSRAPAQLQLAPCGVGQGSDDHAQAAGIPHLHEAGGGRREGQSQ